MKTEPACLSPAEYLIVGGCHGLFVLRCDEIASYRRGCGFVLAVAAMLAPLQFLAVAVMS